MKAYLALVLALSGQAVGREQAIITLNDFPEYAIAGAPLRLTFSIRQNGQAPLTGLHPSIRATGAGGQTATTAAAPGKNRGEYTAAVTLPQPSQWTITVSSVVNGSTLLLPALKVISPGSAAPDRFAPGTEGLRLFSSKGCVGCHRHIEVNPGKTGDAQLDLSGKRFPQDYLKRFLADPAIKPGGMPNFNLKDAEINALAAFINKLASKSIQ